MFKFMTILILLTATLPAQLRQSPFEALAEEFSGKYGQIEVGGVYAGVEFHHSRPVPSRISFYYPVANSIDLSKDYWRRDESRPLSIEVKIGDREFSAGNEPFRYRYTPFAVIFEQRDPQFRMQISYRFCAGVPVVVLEIRLQNLTDVPKRVELNTLWKIILRTCQTYAWKRPGEIQKIAAGNGMVANFEEVDTDSAALILLDAGDLPVSQITLPTHPTIDPPRQLPGTVFRYQKTVRPGEEMAVTQLIGTCRQKETGEWIPKVQRQWRQSVRDNEAKIMDYVKNAGFFRLDDPDFTETANWSKAMLATNRHFLNGKIVPMPCPAEYNFFFTHDMLLTDLGAVIFDTERVKNDLMYLRSLVQADAVLPHAYYWRDGQYHTEFCASDNWNHLWFIILSGAYLRHSRDTRALEKLLPMLQKSLKMILQNQGTDHLMYATRPDWWDIGNVYGARAYLTSLTIRALREYAFIHFQMGNSANGRPFLELADTMQQQLATTLWDEQAGYLMNMLTANTPDTHFYAGSLLSAVFDQLDEGKKRRLLETARRVLLDENVGLHIAMPADFHTLNDVFRFKEGEVGEPYLYFNGGVWPQGIVWYALGWLAAGEPDRARMIIGQYFTLEGIRNSPQGQPSFFEYRNANPGSPRYGEIDKPTFLWAAGWYLNALYQLAGLRNNPWNITFAARLPTGWKNLAYDAWLFGQKARIRYSGEGEYFAAIEKDGKPFAAAVLSNPVSSLHLTRGLPQSAYLDQADCMVRSAFFDPRTKCLKIAVAGFSGQKILLRIVSPKANFRLPDQQKLKDTVISVRETSRARVIFLEKELSQPEETLELFF